jgi:hypothetical protein
MTFEQAGVQINNALAVDRLGRLDKGFDGAAHMDSSLQVEALAGGIGGNLFLLSFLDPAIVGLGIVAGMGGIGEINHRVGFSA